MARSSAKAKNAVQEKYLVKTGELRMDSENLDEMFTARQNKYLLVNLLAKRGRDLNRGELAQVQLPQPHTNTQLALAELETGKLKLIRKEAKKVMVNLIESE